jgi:hypothetical protein
MYPTSINPFTMKTLNGPAEIEAGYAAALGRIKQASTTIPGGAPTLIGEFGIPYDLDGCAAYQAWAKGDHSAAPWEKHVIALDLMYNAMDTHLLNSTQWNYTASNRNDAAIGDGWNQEDLSVFSRDQQANGADINAGGRAVDGFVRPYVRRTQGGEVRPGERRVRIHVRGRSFDRGCDGDLFADRAVSGCVRDCGARA